VRIPLRLWWHESHDSDPLHVWFRERLVAAVAADAAAEETIAT
jgi:hypothetical protein